MLLLGLLSLAAAVYGAAVPNGQTLSLNGIPYYLSGVSVSKIEGYNSSMLASISAVGMDMVPMTVIPVTATTDMESVLADYAHRDDVYQSAFLRVAYLTSDEKSAAIPLAGFSSVLEPIGSELVMVDFPHPNPNMLTTRLSDSLPSGPYFVSVHTGEIYRAYRLYADDYLAFIQATISDEKGGFLPMPAVTENAMTKDVAVPSRLYYTPTADQPLAGLRLGVKDIFHVRGLKTSAGSRSYYYLYDAQNTTAPSIQRLLDLGAVLVGKTGTVQFANGDKPTADWVDFHCPFNPRGDGYQAPGGSSSGSGAAIGAYEWLDLAVGSDTGGSMRSPAANQGIFGNRPSTGPSP